MVTLCVRRSLALGASFSIETELRLCQRLTRWIREKKPVLLLGLASDSFDGASHRLVFGRTGVHKKGKGPSDAIALAGDQESIAPAAKRMKHGDAFAKVEARRQGVSELCVAEITFC